MNDPSLSVVVPVYNEQDNIGPLVGEIVAALRGRVAFEIIYVDDASTDQTRAALRAAMRVTPELRAVVHARQAGQSTAVRNGVRVARGTWIVTLDGDGQNDPADIPSLLAARDRASSQVKLFAGWRVERRDSLNKRLSSRIANAVRRVILGDATPDTGCGLKLFERAVFLELPYFDHMHRFLPALIHRAGWQTLSVPVNHRPRTAGMSKYGMWDRLWVGIVDLFGVAWLVRRARRTDCQELRD